MGPSLWEAALQIAHHVSIPLSTRLFMPTRKRKSPESQDLYRGCPRHICVICNVFDEPVLWSEVIKNCSSITDERITVRSSNLIEILQRVNAIDGRLVLLIGHHSSSLCIIWLQIQK